jgi:hypothetical protein
MAKVKITALDPMISIDAATDQLALVDISDVSSAPTGTTKRATLAAAVQAGLDEIGGLVQHNFAATVDPTATDDADAGYVAGSLYYNTTSGELFVCDDATPGAANWQSFRSWDRGQEYSEFYGFDAGLNNNVENVTGVGYEAGKNNSGHSSELIGRGAGENNTANFCNLIGWLAGGKQHRIIRHCDRAISWAK